MSSRPDLLALQAIQSGRIVVDPEAGAIYRRDGERAELVDKRTAYGRVHVYTRPSCLAMAHRIIWIAVHGLIPGTLQVNHINRVRWDNRIANLELVTATGNARHWRGTRTYDAIGTRPEAIDPAWLLRLDKGEPLPEKDLASWLNFSKRPVQV